MSKNDGGPAFPITGWQSQASDNTGTSLRDWFAGQALEGFISAIAGLDIPAYSSNDPRVFEEHAKSVANVVYAYAEAMMKEREKYGS